MLLVDLFLDEIKQFRRILIQVPQYGIDKLDRVIIEYEYEHNKLAQA